MRLNLNGLTALAGLGLASLVALGGGYVALRGTAADGPVVTTSGDAQRIEQNGVAVELSIQRLDGPGPVIEESDAELTLSITDAKSGEPIQGLTLAAWVDRDKRVGDDEILACRQRIESYLQADLKTRPVLDLNSYVVLALNEGPSISVIDPFLGFGTTNLYARAKLPAPGDDWVLNHSQSRLFVTIPTLDRVAVVNTGTWRVEHTVDVGAEPRDVELQPDGNGVWILDGGPSGEAPGVTVLDPGQMTVRGRISTGAGSHRVVFSDDGLVAYVTNRDAGTVSVIDVPTLDKLADVETGPRPSGIAYAAAARAAYVVDEADGSVTAIDRATHTKRMRVVTNPGTTTIAFDPMSGRWGFVLNTRESIAHVIDGQRDEIVHTFETASAPHQVSFTHSFAYIRALRSADITMVPLTALRDGFFDEQMWPFPAGAMPPGAFDQPGPAAAVVPSPEMHDAVYAANPGEQRIYVYHYMEGMPTPSGTLDNFGERPRAVLTVGRTIQETADGVHRTTVKAPPAGKYDLVFLLEDPRIIHCFDLDVAADPDKVADEGPLELEIKPLEGSERLTAGSPSTIAFDLRNRASGEAMPDIADVQVLLFSPAGWQRRVEAKPDGRGTYGLDITTPVEGLVYMTVAVPSLGVDFNRQRPLILRVASER
jgi:YVTN family beta-propeller protein